MGASALLMLRLTTEDSATDLTDMESDPLMPRLTTDSVMAHTVMASAPLMPRPTTEDSDTAHTDMESAPLMLRPTTDSVMAHTATASALLTPRLTTDLDTDLMVMARGQPMLTTDTADTAPTDTASKRFTTDGEAQPKLKIIAKRKSKSGTKPKLHPGTKSDPRTDMSREFCNLLH